MSITYTAGKEVLKCIYLEDSAEADILCDITYNAE
jgi:hypothetical protein